MELCTPRCCLDKKALWIRKYGIPFELDSLDKLPCNIVVRNWRMRCKRMSLFHRASVPKHPASHFFWRMYSMPVSLEASSMQSESFSADDDFAFEDSQEELLSKPLSRDELKSLIADAEREKLLRKLSEANQQNRFLKRQLRTKEDALVNFKSELAVMEHEIQALVSLAEEIAKSGNPASQRKINGKYIQSHLLSRLKVVHDKVKDQIKDVEAAQSKEVPLFWYGMAECVQVMGTFDGWSQGEHLSPEYTASFTKFSTKLMLRPGRYEIKFLVDGEWHLSPEFPTVGEGLMENNLLIVE